MENNNITINSNTIIRDNLRTDLKKLEKKFIGGEKEKIRASLDCSFQTVSRAFNKGLVSTRMLLRIKNEALKQIELNQSLENGGVSENLELAEKLGLSKT
jgi:ribosomal protein S20